MKEIVRLVSQRQPSRDKYLTRVIAAVGDDLRGAKIRGEGDRAPQALLLDLSKMIVRGRDFAGHL